MAKWLRRIAPGALRLPGASRFRTPSHRSAAAVANVPARATAAALIPADHCMRRRLTAKRLRALLHYAPETGLFHWRQRRGNRAAGGEAGHGEGTGYRAIRVDGHSHLAHRLAWLYVHGRHP